MTVKVETRKVRHQRIVLTVFVLELTCWCIISAEATKDNLLRLSLSVSLDFVMKVAVIKNDHPDWVLDGNVKLTRNCQ